MEKPTALQAGTQKVGGNRADQSAILSERFQRQILTFLPAFFQHKLNLILPMTMQKQTENG